MIFRRSFPSGQSHQIPLKTTTLTSQNLFSIPKKSIYLLPVADTYNPASLARSTGSQKQHSTNSTSWPAHSIVTEVLSLCPKSATKPVLVCPQGDTSLVRFGVSYQQHGNSKFPQRECHAQLLSAYARKPQRT
jgi:hypothetical protein